MRKLGGGKEKRRKGIFQQNAGEKILVTPLDFGDIHVTMHL